MDEAEHDMIPINEEIEKLSFRLNETNKTREITQKSKQVFKHFLTHSVHLIFRATSQTRN